MSNNSLASIWAHGLGLVEAPLFSYQREDYTYHNVLLNGGRGSFALSSSGHIAFNLDEAASWAWSADLPHHVYVTEQDVTLSRWDDPAAVRRFSRQSVENKLESFYEYLLLDRVKSRFDVVDHSIDMLRRVRSHINEQHLSDESSLHVFLFIIASMLSGQNIEAYSHPESLLNSYALDPTHVDSFHSLGITKLSALIEQFRSPSESHRTLELIPQLLIRHAAGTVFQEAHFEFIRSNPTDLFNLPGAAEVRVSTRGGIHFTPPGLARAIVEQAFIDSVFGESLTVLDPACGAGAFLHEALRFLQREGYKGAIKLIGYDISSNAVAMARFTLNEARKDWPLGNIDIQIEVHDSLHSEHEWPIADYIFMNPPFIAWENLSKSQQDYVKDILGKWYVGRPDYSMAFVEKALSSIKNGGVVGTLLPSSILSLEASLKWRRHIIDEATPMFFAVLGEHGLFRHAIVEVAFAIFTKSRNLNANNKFISLWTSEKRGASGEALRNLRKASSELMRGSQYNLSILQKADDWRISFVKPETLRDVSDWRPRPNRLKESLTEIRNAIDTNLGDLFHVQQGIRAGLRKAFILTAEDYRKLPVSERKFFRPVAENKNIKNGRIGPHGFIFYPYTPDLTEIKDENELKRILPIYYERYLKPNNQDLVSRKGMGSRNWWELTRPRAYFNKPEMKLVSAYFGDAGSFALDIDGDYVVVQGFAWFFRPKVRQEFSLIDKHIRDEYRGQIFHAYLALLNSEIFSLMLAEFCPHVAGGQFDLSKRFVDNIPLPNLAKEGRLNPQFGHVIRTLAEEGKAIRSNGKDPSNRINELVAEAYHVPLQLWQIKNR